MPATNCFQKAHIKMIGSSPEEKDHPTLRWKAEERMILVMYF